MLLWVLGPIKHFMVLCTGIFTKERNYEIEEDPNVMFKTN